MPTLKSTIRPRGVWFINTTLDMLLKLARIEFIPTTNKYMPVPKYERYEGVNWMEVELHASLIYITLS
jgi:hypothetical protein